MRKQFEFSEEDLYLAAREAEQFIRAQYPDAQTCPPHTFSPAFEADMQQLFAQLQNGSLKPSAARLGWPYYLRRSIAAILLCFLLACATMPEAVLAGYQKLIEVVGHVFEEYTEFRYRTDAVDDTEFKPLKLGYLPEGMVEANRIEKKNSINLLYKNLQGDYFKIYQSKEIKGNTTLYGIDTENVNGDKTLIYGEKVNIVQKEEEFYFVWQKDNYYINGQTNVSQEELIKILSEVTFFNEKNKE